MTPVLFHFITPDGVPLANARVDIQLSRSSYDEDHDGVLMPRLVEATTDEDGKVTVELAPADVLYHVECWDTDSEAGLSYKFMVPEQEVPNTPIRLQDIVIVGEMSNTSYDEAALIAIHAAKATALTAAIAATASETAAETAATTATAQAVIASTKAGEAAASEAAANTAAGTASTAASSATASAATATTKAGESATSAAAAAASAASATMAANLTGSTLAANVVNASINAITPTGGTLAVTGIVSASSVSAGANGTLSALSPDGVSQLVLTQTNAGSMDLISYKGVGGGSFRLVSGDAGSNTVIGSWGLAALAVTGNVTATGQFTNDNYGLTLSSDGFGYWMSFTGTRAAGIYTDNGTIRIRAESQDFFHLTGSALALTARQTIAVNSASAALTATQNGAGLALDVFGGNDVWHVQVGNPADTNLKLSARAGVSGSEYTLMQTYITNGNTAGGAIRFQRDGGQVFIGSNSSSLSSLEVFGQSVVNANIPAAALNVYNPNAAGYGVRIHSAGVGGEPALAIENAAGSATVFMVQNNGGVIGVSGTFSYGLNLDNNTGVIHFKDTGGTQRRTILRASDQIIFGDVDNSTVDSYVTFCANLSQRHVINNNQIGIWGPGGLNVTGDIVVVKAAGGAGLTLNASTGTADTGMDIRWQRGGVLKWQLGSGFATGGDNIDFYDRGGGDRLVWQAVPNGAFNIMVPTNVASDLTVSAGGHFKITDAPTSSAGLPAGTVWNDSGTLKIA